MRDPKRIDEVLALVREIWMKAPDLRLMQLLLNTGSHYMLEDDQLIHELKHTYATYLKTTNKED